MNKIYTLALGLALLGVAHSTSAQRAMNQQEAPVQFLTPGEYNTSDRNQTSPFTPAGSRDVVVYWSDDFSNGLDGQDGAWTATGPQAQYWFQAFPLGTPNGYNPLAPIGDGTTPYGAFLANYFGALPTVDSETAANGFIMIDADRFNSTRTDPNAAPSAHTTSNAVVTELLSPIIDVTGAPETGLEITYRAAQRLCCAATSSLGVTYSFDGGTTWAPVTNVFSLFGGVNDFRQVTGSVCLSDTIATTPGDLTQFRFKYIFDGGQSHYFWMIDDVFVQGAPENDIAARRTFLTDHEASWFDSEASWLDYFKTFEYEETPSYLTKPLTFGVRVDNICSRNTQTGVRLIVEITNPDMSTETVESMTVDLETPSEVLLYTAPYTPAYWNNADPSGDYVVTFRVEQDEDLEDANPLDNVGGNRAFTITTDATEDGFAIAQNGGRSYNGTFNQAWISQNALVNAPFVFPEPAIANTVITHVEVVFLNAPPNNTQPGEVIFFNVRKGVVDNDMADPVVDPTTVFFGSSQFQYDDPDLEYTIEAEDLWAPADGFPQKWISFELPSPILIEANTVYSPEIKIPQTAPGGPGLVFIPISSVNQERAGFWWRNFSANSAQQSNVWSTGAGFISPSIRLRTSATLEVEKVTYEEGIKITQNWPNPFTHESRFMYQIDKTDRVIFEIRDITGKLAHRENLGTISAGTANTYILNRGGLAPGLYTYSIITSDHAVTRKMVVE